MSEEIKLTLDPFGAQEAEKIAAEDVSVEQKLAELAELTSANLTEEEKAEIAAFAEQIDITDTTSILQYGAGSQQKVADFPTQLLKTFARNSSAKPAR